MIVDFIVPRNFECVALKNRQKMMVYEQLNFFKQNMQTCHRGIDFESQNGSEWSTKIVKITKIFQNFEIWRRGKAHKGHGRGKLCSGVPVWLLQSPRPTLAGSQSG